MRARARVRSHLSHRIRRRACAARMRACTCTPLTNELPPIENSRMQQRRSHHLAEKLPLQMIQCVTPHIRASSALHKSTVRSSRRKPAAMPIMPISMRAHARSLAQPARSPAIALLHRAAGEYNTMTDRHLDYIDAHARCARPSTLSRVAVYFVLVMRRRQRHQRHQRHVQINPPVRPPPDCG